MAETQAIKGTEDPKTGFLLNSKQKFYIDTTGGDDLDTISNGTWARLAVGVTQVTPAGNETTNTDAYYSDESFGSNDVIGKRPQLTFTGNRYAGDKAQDYIVSLEYAIGEAVKTRLIWQRTDGSVIVAKVTVMTIVVSGGNANAKQTFSFVLGFNGKPVQPNGTIAIDESTGKLTLSDSEPE